MANKFIHELTNGTALAASDLLVVERGGSSYYVTASAAQANPASKAGTTTNDSAAAGDVGEDTSSTVLVGAAVSLTTATAANVTSLSLTAGQWLVYGSVAFNGNAATLVVDTYGWISTTSATFPNGERRAQHLHSAAGTAIFAFGNPCYPVPPLPLKLSGTTTVYLSAAADFSVNTAAAFGNIYAIRVR